MDQYEKLKHVATTYYNDSRYCSVLAIAVATGRKYGKCYNVLKRLGRRDRCGSYPMQQAKALNELGYQMVRDNDLTLNARSRWLSKVNTYLPETGVFFVYTSDHVTCVKDGIIQDWSSTKSRKRCQSVYRVLPL